MQYCTVQNYTRQNLCKLIPFLIQIKLQKFHLEKVQILELLELHLPMKGRTAKIILLISCFTLHQDGQMQINVRIGYRKILKPAKPCRFREGIEMECYYM
jgi:hypothetical protein